MSEPLTTLTNHAPTFLATAGTVAISVFLAEIGDKTQLATMLFAADGKVNPWAVFLGSSIALVAAAGIGVVAGSTMAHWIKPEVLTKIAGVAFIGIGLWTLFKS